MGHPGAPAMPAKGSIDLSAYPVEDDAPTDVYRGIQRRLLVTALSAPWPGLTRGRRWQAFANVGLYARPHPGGCVCPDFMLSLDTKPGDLRDRADLAYFLWERRKPPEVVIEIAIDERASIIGPNFSEYYHARVPYCVVFNPLEQGSRRGMFAFGLDETKGGYAPIEAAWPPLVSLGLALWEGACEGLHSTWLRWCDEQGDLIPTPDERAERLAARLRELGINPDEV